jgi:FtsP/CotA-like multicopper oxidase with cupredoxin domain
MERQMFLSKTASRLRLLEAQYARQNRLEIVKALSHGQISRRDLMRWGIFTAGGTLALKSGLSPYAQSAFAAVPTGTPPSPTFGVRKFTQPMPRLNYVEQVPIEPVTPANPMGDCKLHGISTDLERPAKRSSYHTDFSRTAGTPDQAYYKNQVSGAGPCEGRPNGPFFEHQRWEEFYPKNGYVLSLGQIKEGSRFYTDPRLPAGSQPMPVQDKNSVWSFGARAPGLTATPAAAAAAAGGLRTGNLTPPLIKARYGEPILCRIYNDLPVDRADNGGFGRNEISTHYHNAHNGAESDGACNAYHFPGTFYDYHWSSALARRDMPDVWLSNPAKASYDPLYAKKASGPDDTGGLVQVPGDFREIQGTMWFHDHRFFFTAENVHKGNFGMCNMYSGPDRGFEGATSTRLSQDAKDVCLNLPSGSQLTWGNLDFDINLAISNPAFDRHGQLFFDIFDTDGFLGDVLAVNGAYYPYMEVLPRRYRFRILNASMSRFIKLAIAVNASRRFAQGTRVPMYFISNDGNLIVSPLKLLELDEQGVAERYDVVVDFAAFAPGDSVYLMNVLRQTDGRKPDKALELRKVFAGVPEDPAVGPILEFKVVSTLRSVDDHAKVYDFANTNPLLRDKDLSADLSTSDWLTTKSKRLTVQIPLETPVRERTIEFGRSGGGDSRATATGQCIPECGDVTTFPWTVTVAGQKSHSLNANRIAVLVPKPGEVEHWTLVNGGGGWDHPIHLHFEEGITMNRGSGFLPATENLVRKDVWRLRPSGIVKFQVRFGEFGGSYVTHCHNTVHEDFAMLIRYQLLTLRPEDANFKGQPQYEPTKTPVPTPNGVYWLDPEVPD